MKKGFTLIELLVIIAIIGILSSIVLATLQAVRNRGANYYEICNIKKCYYVESYTKENSGNCVYMAEEEIRTCGSFTITKLNEDDNY